MNKNFKAGAQSGFTLIELVVVIVILGILAATALPKFVDMSSDARKASIKAVQGSLNSTSAMIHGKAIVAGATGATGTITVEGVTTNVVYGYPASDTTLLTAAGLSSNDYNIATTATTTTVSMTNGSTVMTGCSVVYTAATSTAPASVAPATTSGC